LAEIKQRNVKINHTVLILNTPLQQVYHVLTFNSSSVLLDVDAHNAKDITTAQYVLFKTQTSYLLSKPERNYWNVSWL